MAISTRTIGYYTNGEGVLFASLTPAWFCVVTQPYPKSPMPSSLFPRSSFQCWVASKRLAFLEPFTSTSLPFDDIAADYYAVIRTKLESIGTPIGPNDIIIASIALAHKLILVTHNTREFDRIEGLHLEDWEKNSAD